MAKRTSVMDQVKAKASTGDDKKAADDKKQEVKPTASKPEATASDADVELQYKELRVPLEDMDPPSFRLHVDLNFHGEQAMATRRLASGLDRNRATLANGRRCVSINDAVRWLAEQLC